MEPIYGPPTVEEAVAWLERHPTNLAYRRECIALWESRHGKDLADKIRAKAKAVWDKRK